MLNSKITKILTNFKQNNNKIGINSYIILWKQLKHQLSADFFSLIFNYKQNICLSLLIYFIISFTALPQLLHNDATSIQHRNLLLTIIKGTLIYGLCWVIVLTIHQRYFNNYQKILQLNNRQSYKRIVLFNFSIAVFYAITKEMPANHYSNKLLSILLVYLWLSQEYVRKCWSWNMQAFLNKKINFINTFSMNQLISLSLIITPLFGIIIPEWYEYIRFIQLFPILLRIIQSFILGTVQEYCNSIKFGLMFIGTFLTIINMVQYSFYFKLGASIFSYYWDIFHDWKLGIRFMKDRCRIDIPIGYFIFGVFATFIGRFLWIFYQINFQQKIIIELTRRSLWNVLRIERESVYKCEKSKKNKVKDVFG